MVKKDIINRIKSWERGDNLGPYSIQLNPTNRCNLSCRFCWQRTEEEINYEEVSEERYLDLLEEAKALSVKQIEITGGGEPLVRKEVTLNAIEKVKELGMKGKIITNGTEFEDEDLERIVDSGWEEIVFSIDGTKETHEFLRRSEGCFDKTLSSMNSLNKIKSRKNADKPLLTLHMVLCNQNIDEITDTIEIAYNNGCKNFFVEPIVTLAFDTDIGKKLKMSEQEIKNAIQNISSAKDQAERLSMNHNLGSLKEELLKKTNSMDEVITEDSKNVKKNHQGSLKGAACFEPWYNMVVRPEGEAGPCCMFDNKGPNIKEKSLEKIWFGKYFEKIRERLKKNELLSFCSKCNPSQVTDNREIREAI